MAVKTPLTSIDFIDPYRGSWHFMPIEIESFISPGNPPRNKALSGEKRKTGREIQHRYCFISFETWEMDRSLQGTTPDVS